ncbi:hypothetical protein CL684_02355 [Candidatus Campbellbacteria bacterium]|nr:hypothetical protein [Candidatus Campbellbacteria bacterium]|tara:strand:+ start:1998 stop:2324 length:327 start_codon:yes stop_codon:yes gene_type:complete
MDKKEIINKIRDLLNELEGLGLDTKKSKKQKIEDKTPTGCIGSIEVLINEGFFEKLRTVSEVVDKLKEEGQPYSRSLVSMNLLNLVKPPKRTLRRIKEEKQWNYIVRS